MSVHASCPVIRGVCPECGTFWFTRWGKRYGTRPIAQNLLPQLIVNGRTVVQAHNLEDYPNVVVIPSV